MSVKSASKSGEQTAASSEKSIDERIADKRDQLYQIHAAMSIHMSKELTREQRAKAVEKQDRLEWRIKQYEEQLLDEKIAIYNDVLNIIRK